MNVMVVPTVVQYGAVLMKNHRISIVGTSGNLSTTVFHQTANTMTIQPIHVLAYSPRSEQVRDSERAFQDAVRTTELLPPWLGKNEPFRLAVCSPLKKVCQRSNSLLP
jgi:hypothetical protein